MPKKQNKYKNAFVTGYNEKQEEAEKQSKLKHKHKIEDENVLVVEKTNTWKFTIRVLILLVKTAAWIILVAFAAVGVLSLIYPETRMELFYLISKIFHSIF